jgi:hypothetical protein
MHNGHATVYVAVRTRPNCESRGIVRLWLGYQIARVPEIVMKRLGATIGEELLV